MAGRAPFEATPDIPQKNIAEEGEPAKMVHAFDLPPLLTEQAHAPIPSLGGHPYDPGTGLTYMHYRYYHPWLSHFLGPDFRQPDIFDPTTWNEPYAYAAGNPFMF